MNSVKSAKVGKVEEVAKAKAQAKAQAKAKEAKEAKEAKTKVEETKVEETKVEETKVEETKEVTEVKETVVKTVDLVIPLAAPYSSRGYRRTVKTVKILKNFIKKHTKNDNIKITDELNKKLWENGIRNPPRKIKVQLLTDENNQIRVYPK